MLAGGLGSSGTGSTVGSASAEGSACGSAAASSCGVATGSACASSSGTAKRDKIFHSFADLQKWVYTTAICHHQQKDENCFPEIMKN